MEPNELKVKTGEIVYQKEDGKFWLAESFTNLETGETFTTEALVPGQEEEPSDV